ncbi:YlxR family protein [Knoellia sp. p5-6-4]|uniref:YlxR family protein n=1 Tax=unclassified Knoellia TaxID=2618719 RepID=UPI0031F3426B
MGTDRTGLQPRRSRAQPEDGAARPIRTCVGCRGRDSRSALLRVVAVRNDQGQFLLVPDLRRCLPGRGAWLHPTVDCFDQALRRRAFGRALRVSVALDPAAVRHHLEALSQRHVQKKPSELGTESGFDADEHPMSTQR